MGKLLVETGGSARMVPREKARDCCQKRKQCHCKDSSKSKRGVPQNDKPKGCQNGNLDRNRSSVVALP